MGNHWVGVDGGVSSECRRSSCSSCFWSVSTAAATATVSATTVLPTLFNFPGKPLQLISSNHTWLTYGCGKFFWHPSQWPWVKVTKLPKQDTIYLAPMIKWEPLIQSLQNLVGISPLLCVFSYIFRKILNPFFPVEHSICHILGMVGPNDVKQKGIESTGC